MFEHPDVSVFPVVSGTAANALSLSALCPPWGSVLCHESAHILVNEAGATSMFTGGAVMKGLPGINHRLDPQTLEQTFAATQWGDPHHSQPSVLSLMDGARFANAIARLGCTPAELTWRAGVDVLTLGATKNGALSTDAIVCFDPSLAQQLSFRLKRAGHVASKMRFQAAQLDAYLTDGLWLRLAAIANAAMSRLAAGLSSLGVQPIGDVPANMVFVKVGDWAADRMEASGLLFYRMGNGGHLRFVTSFQTTGASRPPALDRSGRSTSHWCSHVLPGLRRGLANALKRFSRVAGPGIA